MSGSSLDGLDIVFAELEESRSNWTYKITAADCLSYNNDWAHQLQAATTLSAKEYLLLHTAYGRYIGECINGFIETYQLHHKVQMISSHGHTVFHDPEHKMTAQLGDGAAIAAVTGINVISDLRAMDIALGGQGAPIVPAGERLLFKDYDLYLNLGGIANISYKTDDTIIAFDVCPANKVLNMLAQQMDKPYDENGNMSRQGNVNEQLLSALNQLDYYKENFPKSLDNSFGILTVFPIIQSYRLSEIDALRTYTEHIAQQVGNAVHPLVAGNKKLKMLVTGGGSFNEFLVKRIKEILSLYNVEAYNYKFGNRCFANQHRRSSMDRAGGLISSRLRNKFD